MGLAVGGWLEIEDDLVGFWGVSWGIALAVESSRGGGTGGTGGFAWVVIVVVCGRVGALTVFGFKAMLDAVCKTGFEWFIIFTEVVEVDAVEKESAADAAVVCVAIAAVWAFWYVVWGVTLGGL